MNKEIKPEFEHLKWYSTKSFIFQIIDTLKMARVNGEFRPIQQNRIFMSITGDTDRSITDVEGRVEDKKAVDAEVASVVEDVKDFLNNRQAYKDAYVKSLPK